MAAKDAQLKKTLARDAVILCVALAALAAAGYFLSGYDDDTQGRKADTQAGLDKSHAEYETIKRQLGSGYEIQNYYEVYAHNHNVDFTLNRETATTLLTAFREKYHLTNLEVTIAPISDLGNAPAIKIGIVVKSEVKLVFNALTDNDIYGLISALQRGFPGIVLIDKLTITRTGDLSRNLVVDLSHHKLASLVKGEIDFIWLGMRPKPENAAAGNANAPR